MLSAVLVANTIDELPEPPRVIPPPHPYVCSHLAHLWAISDSAPRFEAVGTPRRQGLCSQPPCPLVGHFCSAPCSEAVGTPQAAGVILMMPPHKVWTHDLVVQHSQPFSPHLLVPPEILPTRVAQVAFWSSITHKLLPLCELLER